MNRSPPDFRADPSAGLCSGCAHSRVTGNRRGSIFRLCRLSVHDARYPRYPRLPVTRCPGFELAAGGKVDDDRKDRNQRAGTARTDNNPNGEDLK